MAQVIDILREHHVFFLDSRTGPHSVGASVAREQGEPTATRDVFLDDENSPTTVQAQLALTERIARQKGSAIAIGHPHQETLEALETWIPQAQAHGFEIVGVRALVNKNP